MEGPIFLVASELGFHDAGAGLRRLVCFDPIREGLTHQCLKLAAFAFGQRAHSG